MMTMQQEIVGDAIISAIISETRVVVNTTYPVSCSGCGDSTVASLDNETCSLRLLCEAQVTVDRGRHYSKFTL